MVKSRSRLFIDQIFDRLTRLRAPIVGMTGIDP